jgi:uncharacterized membrane protein YdjX (TVP38/TMEM64 family)
LEYFVKQPATTGTWRKAKPFAIAAFLIAGLGAFFAFDLHQYASFEVLAAERDNLAALVDSNPIAAPAVLMALYALVVLFSLPVAAFLTPAIGFLLGTAMAAGVVVIGATLGATALFLLARSGFGERWRPSVERTLKRLDSGFQNNAFQYLLILRLMPVVPFFLLNILPAFAGVPLRSYVAATFIGIIPGSIVYASIGAGLDAVFARGEVPTLAIFSDPAVILPLAGLAVLAALPMIYRRWKNSQHRSDAQVTPNI